VSSTVVINLCLLGQDIVKGSQSAQVESLIVSIDVIPQDVAIVQTDNTVLQVVTI
jgi:hypothetical protein